MQAKLDQVRSIHREKVILRWVKWNNISQILYETGSSIGDNKMLYGLEKRAR